MRRFVTLLILLLCSVPFGVSISGCSKNVAPIFCNGGDSGITTGQITTISLAPIVFGISLNQAEIGQVTQPTAADCKGNSASSGSFIYATTDMTIADVQPNTGRLCGGTWNRNTGGGIPDFTYCIPTNKSGTAYIAASADGVTSNPLPIFVHPVVTNIVLGAPSTNCATDPATNCGPASINLAAAATANGGCPVSTTNPLYSTNPLLPNGCCTHAPNVVAPLTPPAPPYAGTSCSSQGTLTQLSARVYAGANNISCLAGHLEFSAQGYATSTAISTVVSIDPNGVATANQPGSVLISANVANAASSAGFFSTCPPASITLSAPGAVTSGSTVIENQNNTQPLIATAVDTNGVPLTGLLLEYESTQPNTIPGGAGGSVTPLLAGAASISATCQPPGCNSASYNQIGLFGNGKPVTSNSVNITAPGTNATVLYMASTQSLYVETRDFTQTSLAAPFLLPYLPNSMVISTDGSTIYMGSATGLMVLNAVSSLSTARVDLSSPGTVLALSPDGTQVVIADPVKNVISLENSSGGVISTYGATCPATATPTSPVCRAEFAPDSQTLYIAAGNQLLVYSGYSGWTNVTPATPAGTPVTDVAVTVPSVGAYFAGKSTTSRSYCAISTPTSPTIEANQFYPPADTASSAAPTTATDRIAATNDGLHILGATVTTTPATLNDLQVEIPAGNTSGPSATVVCPPTGTLNFFSTVSPIPLGKITAGAITGVLPTSDSKFAFVTYTLPTGSTASSPYLPAYSPGAVLPIPYVTLSGAATAPVAGVISSDNSTVYVGTSGDNLVHIIPINGSTSPGTWIDSTLTPNLTLPNSTATVPVNLLVQKPRKTT